MLLRYQCRVHDVLINMRLSGEDTILILKHLYFESLSNAKSHTKKSKFFHQTEIFSQNSIARTKRHD